MRLFIGSFATIDHLDKIQSTFHPVCEGKWVKKRSIHLTFAFLGEVQEPQIIIENLENIRYTPKDIPIEGLGFFGSPPKVLFAKIDDEEITKLHQEIAKKLELRGQKPFIPHITLCRIKKVKNYPNFLEKIKKFEGKTLGSLHLRLELIKSTLTPKGPIYESLHTFGSK